MEGRPPSQLSVEIAQHSDPGRDPNKQVNEDSCGYANTKFGHLIVLCDGMGGHYGGQEASRRAITTIFEQIEKAPAHLTPATAMKLAIEEAGRRVYELGGPPDNRVRPGSTVVAMLLHDAGVDVAHVGDSRAYVVRSNQIYPLTRDHSMVQSMIDAGFLTEEQAIGHPDANKITRALGMKPEVDVEVRPEPMELFPGDVLLQSSDGLTDLAISSEILAAVRQALNAGNVEYCCQQLVRMANDRGGHDNITVQMARVLKTAPKQTRAGLTNAPDSNRGGPVSAHGGLQTVADGGPKFTASDYTPHAAPATGSYGAAKPTIPMASTTPMMPSPVALASAGLPAMTPPQALVATAPSGPLPHQGVSPTMASMSAPAGAPQMGSGSSPHGSSQGYAGGLAPPPPSIRYGQGAAATPPMGQQIQAPQPYNAPPPAGAQPGYQTNGSGWDSGLPSAPPVTTGNRNVLFLWLGVAFMLATVVLILIWALFLR